MKVDVDQNMVGEREAGNSAKILKVSSFIQEPLRF